MKKTSIIAAITAALLVTGASCHAASPRDREIAECRDGEIALWNDGVDRPSPHAAWRILYRHEGAPAWFAAREVEALLTRAADAWSACGITLRLAPQTPSDDTDGTIVVHWNDPASRGNFGLANLSARTLSLGPGAFGQLRARNPGFDATQTLQMVISHELGHFLGLMAHSRRCVDVLSYYDDGKGQQCFARDRAAMAAVVEYRSVLPTACDIARCRAVNAPRR